jgi:hypothetical protein
VGPRFGRRDLLRAAVAGVVATAAGTSVDAGPVAVTAGASSSVGAGIRAFKLYTGPDHASHALEGTIDERDRTDEIAIHFHLMKLSLLARRQAEQRVGIFMGNLLPILRGYWQVLEESHGRHVVAEGVVNRKQKAIGAKGH